MSSKTYNSCIIYSPSCFYKSVWLYFSCETQQNWKKETSHTIQNILFCVQQKTESHTGLERHEGVYINLFLGDLFKDNLFYINS